MQNTLVFLRELQSLSVLRFLGRNGPVICLVEVQHYHAVESRTIIVSFKEPYLSQKEGSLFICVHTNMNTYFVGDSFWETPLHRFECFSSKAVILDGGLVSTFTYICTGVMFRFWVTYFNYSMCVILTLNLKVVDCI